MNKSYGMTLPRIVGFGGTTRPNSSSERLTRGVLDACHTDGAEVKMFGGEFLADLPLYDPEAPDRSASQLAFLEAVRNSEGVVIGTPSYHGSVSGLVKNAIDLLQDLSEDRQPYFDNRPVGIVVSAAGWQATGTTLSSLRDIVHALRGWPTPYGLTVNTLKHAYADPETQAWAPDVERVIKLQAQQIMQSISARRAHELSEFADAMNA